MVGRRTRFAVPGVAGAWLAVWAFAWPGRAADAGGSAAPTFAKDVRPILEARCLSCHGERMKGRLDLRTPAGLAKGGDNGPAITPGSPESSVLWQRVDVDQMPPGRDKLAEREKDVIKAWIEAGASEVVSATVIPAGSKVRAPETRTAAADRDFWSFKPPERPAVPSVRQVERVRNPVDAFVLSALERRGLTLSPDVEPLTLLRRVSLDVTGLPPTPEEIRDFLADRSPDAYEKVVDRLLASPRYGERWGRHWLDVAGYADSESLSEFDVPRTAAWRYRDYVIRSLNADKPFDRFVQEQIAGDELCDYWGFAKAQKDLTPEAAEALIATGFLRCASDTTQAGLAVNAPASYYQTLDDTVKIATSAVMGLTVECARCHDHKYDPIPQADYYRVQAVFMSAYRPVQWIPQPQRRLVLRRMPGEADVRAAADAAIAKLRRQEDELRSEFAGYLYTGRLAKLPDAIREDVRQALAVEPSRRTEVQRYLADRFEPVLRPDAATLERILPETFATYKTRLREIQDQIRAEKMRRGAGPEIRALYDMPGDAKTNILVRGDVREPGAEVRPGVPAVLTTPEPFSWSEPPADVRTSSRRLAFARWLAQPGHPLTARVFVNRVWMHHFGEGMVSTPENFGRQGARPSHPELLDWLATEFVAKGWSVKALHRLIVTSSAYRQSSAIDPARHAVALREDAEDSLLWRQRMRRLEAEAVRDSVLAVSGRLNSEMYGPPVAVTPAASARQIVRASDDEVAPPDTPAGRRRSVYLQVLRSQPVTLLELFDQPRMETNCTRRFSCTVSSQALSLLNGEFMSREAEAFADRVAREAPNDAPGRAVLVAFGRPATAAEHERMNRFLEEQTDRHRKPDPTKGSENSDPSRRALSDLCHMLLSANEFLYTD